jgi:hypothetical protein
LNGEPIGLEEGLNKYTITVTPADNSESKEYPVHVVKLPDLTLSTFKITKDDWMQELEPGRRADRLR